MHIIPNKISPMEEREVGLHQQLESEKNIVPKENVIETPLPSLNINDSIFKKLEKKESFSPDDVYKIITAISKKESSKRLIETFMTNLKVMADEANTVKHTIPKGSEFERSMPYKQSGRNAFELRTALVEMSMGLLLHNKRDVEITPDDVTDVAKILYAFVENKQ